MKAFTKVFGLMAVLVAALAPASTEAATLGAMRVSLAEGDVQVKIADTGDWVPASINMPLVEGDELWVPEGSRAELQTNNGAYVRLGGATAFQVLRVDRNSFQFHLAQGHAYVLSRAPERSVLQLDTPDTSVRSFGRTRFRIDVPDGETDVSVFDRSVLAESEAGTTRIRAGNMLALGPGGFAELSPLPPPDAWEDWNRRRDRIVLARGESNRHLPDELRVYSGDLDANGRWVYVQDYGYCWTPTVLVISDWAPYRHGRWVWRGGEYVWIGYEPWGWAPYHYGRWTFVARIGWCWVPPARGDVYWGPGYVGWVRTPEHVAWVPLAPRETYYGYGHYGRHSVNITNVNITQVRVTNVYRNVNVTNSVTVVNETTFVTGRPAPVNRGVVANVRENFAQRRNIVVGRPPVRPVDTSHVPVVRSIPEAKHPPAAVRKIDIKQLRQSRPLVTEAGRSAIRPGSQPRALEVRKVEKPRSFEERARERREGRPAAPRGPGAPAGGPPAKVEGGGKPAPAVPREPRRKEAPPAERMERRGGQPQEPPAEKGRPEARPGGGAERKGKPAEAVGSEPPRGKPEEAAERARPREVQEKKAAPARPAAQDRSIERGKPQKAPARRVEPEAPQGRPEGAAERARPREVQDKKAAPARPAARDRSIERGKPQKAPAESVGREAPQGRPERDEERGRRKEAPEEEESPGQPEGGTGRDVERERERGGNLKTLPSNERAFEWRARTEASPGRPGRVRERGGE